MLKLLGYLLAIWEWK